LTLFLFGVVANLPEGFIMSLSTASWVWFTIKNNFSYSLGLSFAYLILLRMILQNLTWLLVYFHFPYFSTLNSGFLILSQCRLIGSSTFFPRIVEIWTTICLEILLPFVHLGAIHGM
jgi:hypothetical protein